MSKSLICETSDLPKILKRTLSDTSLKIELNDRSCIVYDYVAIFIFHRLKSTLNSKNHQNYTKMQFIFVAIFILHISPKDSD